MSSKLNLLPEPLAHRVRPSKPFLSAFVKGGLGLMVAANVDMIASFSTAYWATWKQTNGDYGGYGLWKIWRCSNADGVGVTQGPVVYREGCDERMVDATWPAWYIATQVMESLGLAGLLTSLVMLLLYIFHPSWEKNKVALSSLIGISYFAGLCIVVGLIVFSYFVIHELQVMTQDWFLSWSFSLACTAFVMNQIAASVLVTENKRLLQQQARPYMQERLKDILDQDLMVT